jgi:[FeFe] hydrogenase H-cluster maturation GTPase HydF
MALTDTPRSDRLHIILLGRRNSGKSSLINALTGQDVALVSDMPGTTTDPVMKAMEIHGIGPVLFIDTAGLDDEGELGSRRVELTLKALDTADIALLLCQRDMLRELPWLERLKERHIPTVLVMNKSDELTDAAADAAAVEKVCGESPVIVSALKRTGMELIRRAIVAKMPPDFGGRSITGPLASAGDVVLLVMPQDIQAPKGRLILPQVQTLRELLDKHCEVMCCTTDRLEDTLKALSRAPDLIITDSQAFATVYAAKPPTSKLTSFSVLFAAYKGDIDYFVEGAAAIGRLNPHSRVLIAEACTHVPLAEDIGRVKLPRLLRRRVGEELAIDIVSGNDFPSDLSPYALIIHCGACMFNRRYVLHRVDEARAQGIPMTNYGIAIAWLNGILDKVSL